MKVTAVKDVQQLPQTFAATIPEEYLDAMGHMNVMWYTYLFSQGMQGLFELIGMGPKYIAETNNGSFALEKHIRYLAEVRVGQKVQVHSRLVERGEKRFRVFNFLINETRGRLSATSETVGTHVDLGLRRSAVIPDSIKANMDRLINEQNKLTWKVPVSGITLDVL